ncbi:MAG: hypothetical protein N2169_04435 [bacterium]|nr:hypothetical protein [bacterium]
MIFGNPDLSILNQIPQGDRSQGINPYRLIFEPHQNISQYNPVEIDKRRLREEIQRKLHEYFLKAAGCEQVQNCDPLKLLKIQTNTTMGYRTEIQAIGNMISDNESKFYVVNGKYASVVDSDPSLAQKIAQETDSIIHDFFKRSSSSFPTKLYIVSEEIGINKPHSSLEVGVAKYSKESDALGTQQSILGEYVDKNGKRIKSLENMDTLSHEIGHAILENLNPSARRDVHEAFADTVTFLVQASRKESIQKIKQQNIDLTKSNFISQISEGSQYYKELQQHPLYGEPDKIKEYVRDLAGVYKYDEKETSPYKRSLSLSSTIYSSWTEYIKYLQSQGKSTESSIHQANEIFKTLLVKTAENKVELDIPNFANIFLQNINDPKLREIFIRNAKLRNIPIR